LKRGSKASKISSLLCYQFLTHKKISTAKKAYVIRFSQSAVDDLKVGRGFNLNRISAVSFERASVSSWDGLNARPRRLSPADSSARPPLFIKLRQFAISNSSVPTPPRPLEMPKFTKQMVQDTIEIRYVKSEQALIDLLKDRFGNQFVLKVCTCKPSSSQPRLSNRANYTVLNRRRRIISSLPSPESCPW